MGDVSGLDKPKGVIGGFWNKLLESAQAVTDDDEVVLFVGVSSGETSSLAGSGLLGLAGAAVARLASGSAKTKGLADGLPNERSMLVVLTVSRFGVGPQKATRDAMRWVPKEDVASLTVDRARLRVTFSDDSQRLLAFPVNSRGPLKTAVERFFA